MGRYLTYKCSHCLHEARSGPGPMAHYATRSVVCTTHRQIEEVMAENRRDHLEHSLRATAARLYSRQDAELPEAPADLSEARRREQEGLESVVDEGLDHWLKRLEIRHEELELEWRTCEVCALTGPCAFCGQAGHAPWGEEHPCRCGVPMVTRKADLFVCPSCDRMVAAIGDVTTGHWRFRTVVCPDFGPADTVQPAGLWVHATHGECVAWRRADEDDSGAGETQDPEEVLRRIGVDPGAFEAEYLACPRCRIGTCRKCGERDHPAWTDLACPRCGTPMDVDPDRMVD